MNESSVFYEVRAESLTRRGEEVCGDQVKVWRAPDETIAALSDGLGSGIKANILARLTTEIIVTMLRHRAPLQEVVETVVGTLPVCRERGLAYATFAVARVRHADGRFEIASFDSPPAVWLRQRGARRLEIRRETVCGKLLERSEGVLERGDFLGLMSDGLLHASPDAIMDPTWGWEAVAACLETAVRTGRTSAEALVQAVTRETRRRYGGNVGDDATFVGVLARQPRRLVLLTGPPADPSRDAVCVERLLGFEGRRVVCGGATANLVAEHTGEIVRTDESTRRENLPPIGDLPDVDLVTEGILTLARTLELLRACGGDIRRLPVDRNGAVLVARELLQADSILFLAGESVNPHYQNPQLPRSVSIRRSLVTQLAEILERSGRGVTVEWI